MGILFWSSLGSPLPWHQPFVSIPFTEDRFLDIARLRHLPRETLPTYRPDALPITTAGNERLLELPTFPLAERALLDQYALAFEKVIAAASEIAEADTT